ncbi:MAG: hypothetical protein KC933_15305 [Myxococcales bacterium]|nr:hypothetical protein [Myxococcales bacterium]
MLWPARACTLGFLALLACRESAAPPLPVDGPRDAGPSRDAGMAEPRDTLGVDPNPAPSPVVMARVGVMQDILQGWPADAEPWSAIPADSAVYGLSGVLSTRVLSAQTGAPLLYEVADDRQAVLLRRNPDGNVRALRTRDLSAPPRAVAADGRFEAWWDRGLWVQSLDSTDEARRYPVPEAIDSIPDVYAWGDHDLVAVVTAEDGWHAYRVSASGAPTHLGVVGAMDDWVWTEGGRLFVRQDDQLIDIALDGARTTIDVGPSYESWIYGSSGLFVRDGAGATWLDFETGMSRDIEGVIDDPWTAQRISPDGHLVVNRADGVFGVLDMRTGVVRWVPDSATDEVDCVATDGRRLVISGADLGVFDVASGALLHRWEGAGGSRVAAMSGGGHVLLQVRDETVRRVALDTGASEQVPATLRGMWGDTGILGPPSYPQDVWLARLGGSPRRVPMDLESGNTEFTRFPTAPLRFLHSRLDASRSAAEYTVLDVDQGPLWRIDATYRDRPWISGDRVWRFDAATETVSFLDLDASPAVLRSVVLSGASWSYLWPARSSVVVEVGDELVEVYADGAQTATRALGQYRFVLAAAGGLWARQGGDLYHIELDGQASLRISLPEWARVDLRLVTDERAVVRADFDGLAHYYSVAVRGPAEHFEFPAAAVAAGVYNDAILDPQGRLLLEEDGRLVAYGASEQPEVLLAPPDGAVDGVWKVEGRWMALTRGADGNQLWWPSPDGAQHVQVTSAPMRTWLRPLGEGLVWVASQTGQVVLDLAERRVTRVPRDALAGWVRLDEGRLVGPLWARDGLWVWDMRNDTLTPLLVPGLGSTVLLEVLPSSLE